MRRLGDALNKPSIRDTIKQQYYCEHVQRGFSPAVNLDTPYGRVLVCQECRHKKLNVISECRTVLAS